MSLIEDLDCYHDELAAEGWHNAAKGCADAIDEIERLRAALQRVVDNDRWNSKPYTGTDKWHYGVCAEIAREALNETDQSSQAFDASSA